MPAVKLPTKPGKPVAKPVKPAVAKKPSAITWGPVAAIIVTLFVFFAAQLLGGIVIVLIAKLHGWNADQIDAWTNQVGPQFSYYLLVEGTTLWLLWLFLRRRQANFKTLGLIKPRWIDLAYVVIGFAIYFPLLLLSTALVKAWFPHVDLNQPQQIGFSGAHGASLILVFISLAVLPPFTEEILMRGFLFLGLRRKFHLIPAALITSVLFASAHLQAGSGAPLLWAAAVDTFVLSMVLVFLRVKTNRLWASIGLHMLKNTIAFLALFIFIH